MKDDVLAAKAGARTLGSGKEQGEENILVLKPALSSVGSGFLPRLSSDAINFFFPPGSGDSVAFHV